MTFGDRHSARNALSLLLLLFAAALAIVPTPATAATSVHIHFFWSATCPHCRAMEATLERISRDERGIVLHSYEVSGNTANADLFDRVVAGLELPPAVPVVTIGNMATVGHDRRSEAEIRQMIAQCRAGACPDAVARYLPPAQAPPGPQAQAPPARPRLQLPESVDLPLVGEVRTADLSLSALTVAMAAIDGFNPCAMWVLVFLLGLLLDIRNRKRMWLLAGTFLAATAIVYFLVLAAWLNVLLIVGALAWVRIAVGVVALGAGAAYLRKGLQREAVCEVTRPAQRRRIFDRVRALVQQRNLAVAMAGIALLAIAVNFVELLCSAGIPAVYAGILAQTDLSPLGHYLHLALYVLVFLADDAILVAIALIALRIVPTEGRFARWVRLAGGIVMLALGLMLIFRPDWLSFALA